jgi:hypothetical protein
MFFTLDQAVEWFQRQSAEDVKQKTDQDRKGMAATLT